MNRQIVSRVGNYVICQGMAADAGLWFTQRGKEVKEFFSREEAEKFAQDAGPQPDDKHDLRNPKTVEDIHEAHRRGLISDRTRNELMAKVAGMRAAKAE